MSSDNSSVSNGSLVCELCKKDVRQDLTTIQICQVCNKCQYCSRECQVRDWDNHRVKCGKMSEGRSSPQNQSDRYIFPDETEPQDESINNRSNKDENSEPKEEFSFSPINRSENTTTTNQPTDGPTAPTGVSWGDEDFGFEFNFDESPQPVTTSSAQKSTSPVFHFSPIIPDVTRRTPLSATNTSSNPNQGNTEQRFDPFSTVPSVSRPSPAENSPVERNNNNGGDSDSPQQRDVTTTTTTRNNNSSSTRERSTSNSESSEAQQQPTTESGVEVLPSHPTSETSEMLISPPSSLTPPSSLEQQQQQEGGEVVPPESQPQPQQEQQVERNNDSTNGSTSSNVDEDISLRVYEQIQQRHSENLEQQRRIMSSYYQQASGSGTYERDIQRAIELSLNQHSTPPPSTTTSNTSSSTLGGFAPVERRERGSPESFQDATRRRREQQEQRSRQQGVSGFFNPEIIVQEEGRGRGGATSEDEFQLQQLQLHQYYKQQHEKRRMEKKKKEEEQQKKKLKIWERKRGLQEDRQKEKKKVDSINNDPRLKGLKIDQRIVNDELEAMGFHYFQKIKLSEELHAMKKKKKRKKGKGKKEEEEPGNLMEEFRSRKLAEYKHKMYAEYVGRDMRAILKDIYLKLFTSDDILNQKEKEEQEKKKGKVVQKIDFKRFYGKDNGILRHFHQFHVFNNLFEVTYSRIKGTVMTAVTELSKLWECISSIVIGECSVTTDTESIRKPSSDNRKELSIQLTNIRECFMYFKEIGKMKQLINEFFSLMDPKLHELESGSLFQMDQIVKKIPNDYQHYNEELMKSEIRSDMSNKRDPSFKFLEKNDCIKHVCSEVLNRKKHLFATTVRFVSWLKDISSLLEKKQLPFQTKFLGHGNQKVPSKKRRSIRNVEEEEEKKKEEDDVTEDYMEKKNEEEMVEFDEKIKILKIDERVDRLNKILGKRSNFIKLLEEKERLVFKFVDSENKKQFVQKIQKVEKKKKKIKVKSPTIEKKKEEEEDEEEEYVNMNTEEDVRRRILDEDMKELGRLKEEEQLTEEKVTEYYYEQMLGGGRRRKEKGQVLDEEEQQQQNNSNMISLALEIDQEYCSILHEFREDVISKLHPEQYIELNETDFLQNIQRQQQKIEHHKEHSYYEQEEEEEEEEGEKQHSKQQQKIEKKKYLRRYIENQVIGFPRLQVLELEKSMTDFYFVFKNYMLSYTKQVRNVYRLMNLSELQPHQKLMTRKIQQSCDSLNKYVARKTFKAFRQNVFSRRHRISESVYPRKAESYINQENYDPDDSDEDDRSDTYEKKKNDLTLINYLFPKQKEDDHNNKLSVYNMNQASTVLFARKMFFCLELIRQEVENCCLQRSSLESIRDCMKMIQKEMFSKYAEFESSPKYKEFEKIIAKKEEKKKTNVFIGTLQSKINSIYVNIVHPLHDCFGRYKDDVFSFQELVFQFGDIIDGLEGIVDEYEENKLNFEKLCHNLLFQKKNIQQQQDEGEMRRICESVKKGRLLSGTMNTKIWEPLKKLLLIFNYKPQEGVGSLIDSLRLSMKKKRPSLDVDVEDDNIMANHILLPILSSVDRIMKVFDEKIYFSSSQSPSSQKQQNRRINTKNENFVRDGLEYLKVLFQKVSIESKKGISELSKSEIMKKKTKKKILLQQDKNMILPTTTTTTKVSKKEENIPPGFFKLKEFEKLFLGSQEQKDDDDDEGVMRKIEMMKCRIEQILNQTLQFNKMKEIIPLFSSEEEELGDLKKLKQDVEKITRKLDTKTHRYESIKKVLEAMLMMVPQQENESTTTNYLLSTMVNEFSVSYSQYLERVSFMSSRYQLIFNKFLSCSSLSDLQIFRNEDEKSLMENMKNDFEGVFIMMKSSSEQMLCDWGKLKNSGMTNLIIMSFKLLKMLSSKQQQEEVEGEDDDDNNNMTSKIKKLGMNIEEEDMIFKFMSTNQNLQLFSVDDDNDAQISVEEEEEEEESKLEKIDREKMIETQLRKLCRLVIDLCINYCSKRIFIPYECVIQKITDENNNSGTDLCLKVVPTSSSFIQKKKKNRGIEVFYEYLPSEKKKKKGQVKKIMIGGFDQNQKKHGRVFTIINNNNEDVDLRDDYFFHKKKVLSSFCISDSKEKKQQQQLLDLQKISNENGGVFIASLSSPSEKSDNQVIMSKNIRLREDDPNMFSRIIEERRAFEGMFDILGFVKADEGSDKEEKDGMKNVLVLKFVDLEFGSFFINSYRKKIGSSSDEEETQKLRNEMISRLMNFVYSKSFGYDIFEEQEEEEEEENLLFNEQKRMMKNWEEVYVMMKWLGEDVMKLYVEECFKKRCRWAKIMKSVLTVLEREMRKFGEGLKGIRAIQADHHKVEMRKKKYEVIFEKWKGYRKMILVQPIIGGEEGDEEKKKKKNIRIFFRIDEELRKSVEGILLLEDKIQKKWEEIVENDTEVNASRCIICMDKPPKVVLVPCYHMVFCSECILLSHEHGLDHCPICRKRVQSSQEVYFS